MTTSKPRIAITLEQREYDILRRLAALQRAPMSKIVAGLVAEMTPILGRLVDTMELAAKAQENVKASLRQAVDRAEETIVPHAQSVLRQYEEFDDELRGLVGQIEDMKDGDATAAARADGGAATEESPRPVTTGATKGQQRAKAGSKGRGAAR